MNFSLRSGARKKNVKQASKIKKILNIAITVILLIAFALAVSAMLYLFAQVIAGNSPSLFGYRFYFVITDSMSPVLEPNDIILSKVIKDTSDIEKLREIIKEDDIITYKGMIQGRKANITHRVIKDKDYDDIFFYDNTNGEWMLQTKGDRNIASDAPIYVSQINGIMIKKVKIISAIYNFITKPLGKILLIGIPVLFIICVMILRVVIAASTPVSSYKKITKAERAQMEKDIARKAVEEYQKLEREIARKAVEEYKRKIDMGKE